MSEELDKLQSIGAQKIHEATHLSKEHIQALLHESFDTINKVQFFGFVSILEREYNLDLLDLKKKGEEYYSSLNEKGDNKAKNVFVTPKRKKDYTTLYIIIAVMIFLAVAIFSVFTSSKTAKKQDIKIEELNNSAIEKATKTIEPKVVDKNTTLTKLPTQVKKKETIEIKKEIAPVEKKVLKSLKVAPRSKVWMGFIDLKTYKKRQKVFKDPYEMDTTKEWIIVFGHGSINMIVNGVVQKYSYKSNLRFHYKDGVLRKIDFEEFKRLNRGKKW